MASNHSGPDNPIRGTAPGGTKKPYARPTILSRQRLEAVATNCGKVAETPTNPLCNPLLGGTLIS